MSDLIDPSPPGENAPEFTVSELSGAVRRVIEGEFGLVRVRGEVGRVSRPRSGHVYLDLKDEGAVLAGVIWKGAAARLAVQPEEGMEVVATGRLTTFPGQSRYQIVIDSLRPAGVGALMALLEARRKALAAEGLFAEDRKKALPFLPEVIGVVTSPSGAVIRDILHRLRERFPRRVLIWPVAVQGEACAAEVARAIAGFNRLEPGGAPPRPDLIIVARGGGSVEDLWGFNEEAVVRAAAASDIPLISAVGHETDTTLIDLAADRRAPTPTAAAELAVPVRLDLLARLDGLGARLGLARTRALGERRQRLRDLARALPRADTLLDGPRQRLDGLAEGLPAALIRSVQMRRIRLYEQGGVLRPALLRGALASHRHVLRDRTARLNVAALRRDIDRKQDDAQSLARRLSEAARRQTGRWKDRIETLERLMSTMSYKATLKRGYAVVHGERGPVTTAVAARRETVLGIEFADGRMDAVPRSPAPAKPRKPGPGDPDQGALF